MKIDCKNGTRHAQSSRREVFKDIEKLPSTFLRDKGDFTKYTQSTVDPQIPDPIWSHGSRHSIKSTQIELKMLQSIASDSIAEDQTLIHSWYE